MTLLFNDRDVLLFSPALAAKIGLNEAIALQQINYWITRDGGGVIHDDRKWIYNTLPQWRAQLPFMSETTIKRTMQSLKDLLLIEIEQLSENNRDRTNYYTINHAEVERISVRSNWPHHEVKLASSIRPDWPAPNKTETTTETTSINTVKTDVASSEKTKPAKAKKLEKPDDVDPQIWEDWLQLRKSKKAPVTQTALDGIRREAAKARLSLEKALETCCSNGWQGFKADWVTGGVQQGQRHIAASRPMPMSFAERDREERMASWERMTGKRHPERDQTTGGQRPVIDITPRGDSLYLD